MCFCTVLEKARGYADPLKCLSSANAQATLAHAFLNITGNPFRQLT